MTDPITVSVVAFAALAATAILAFAGLRGWNGWLALEKARIDRTDQQQKAADYAQPSAAARIEVADLKERIRRLEAIAAGVDL